jgi:hypothetical protein
VGEKGAAEKPHEVGIQLVGSENIWGIEFPSYDQLKSALPVPSMKIHSIQHTETAGEDEARLFQEKAEGLCRSSGLTGQTNPLHTAKNIEEYEGSKEFGKKAEDEHQRSALSSFRKALEQECAEVLARMKCELAQALQDVTEQAARQASALNDLRKAIEEESLQTLATVKTAANQAIGEVWGQIERQANACPELSGEVQEESATTLAQA